MYLLKLSVVLKKQNPLKNDKALGSSSDLSVLRLIAVGDSLNGPFINQMWQKLAVTSESWRPQSFLSIARYVVHSDVAQTHQTAEHPLNKQGTETNNHSCLDPYVVWSWNPKNHQSWVLACYFGAHLEVWGSTKKVLVVLVVRRGDDDEWTTHKEESADDDIPLCRTNDRMERDGVTSDPLRMMTRLLILYHRRVMRSNLHSQPSHKQGLCLDSL